MIRPTQNSKMRLLNILLILFTGVNLLGQNCFIQLFDATGIDMASDVQDLDDQSCILKNTFPSEFQSQFKVFDLGYYSLNEYMDGSFESIWNEGIADAAQQSTYYIIFGRQLQDGNGENKIWFSMNLPNTGGLSCIQPDQITFLENLISTMLNETTNPLAFANAELDAVLELTDWITIFKNCCETSCEEICDNGIDDDFDGLVDCDDIDCLYEQIGLKDDPATKKSVTSCYILNAAEETCIAAHGAFYESLALDSDEAMFLCRAVPAYTFPELPNLPDFDLLDWLIDQIKETGNELARRILIKTVQSIAAYAQSEVEAYLENLIQNGTPFQISIGLFIEFATGLGPQSRHFEEDHTLTISLKESNYTCLALRAWHNGYLEVIDPNNPRTDYPPGYRVDFPQIENYDLIILEDSILSIPYIDFNETGPIRELIADGGYTAAQFIGTGYFDFDYNVSSQVLSLELWDSKTLFSLLFHLVDDRHPRTASPFFGETEQTYSFSMTLSEIETRIQDCNTEICDNFDSNGNPIDDDGDGYANCDDFDCISEDRQLRRTILKSLNPDACYLLTDLCVNPLDLFISETENDQWLQENIEVLRWGVSFMADHGCTEEMGNFISEAFDLKRIDEAIKMDRLGELYLALQANSDALTESCSQQNNIDEQDYAHLFNHTLPQQCVTRLNNLGDDFFYQDLDNADSPSINMDHYSTEISAIPDFDDDGMPDDSNVLFEKIRENFLTLASGTKDNFNSNCTFGGTPDIWWNFEDYPGFISPSSTERWLGFDPISTIFLIDAGAAGPIDNAVADLGAVMVSDITGCCWIFSTVATPVSGSQPFSGHRQFGLRTNERGNLEFFTRAVDRAKLTPFMGWLVNDACSIQDYFDIGDITWSGLMIAVTEFINNSKDGSATVYRSDYARPDYEDIKSRLTSDEPIMINCH